MGRPSRPRTQRAMLWPGPQRLPSRPTKLNEEWKVGKTDPDRQPPNLSISWFPVSSSSRFWSHVLSQVESFSFPWFPNLPISRFSSCKLFQISISLFPNFQGSSYPKSRFPDFPISRFELSDFPISRFSSFELSDFPIFWFTNFPISDFPSRELPQVAWFLFSRFPEFPTSRFSESRAILSRVLSPFPDFPVSRFRAFSGLCCLALWICEVLIWNLFLSWTLSDIGHLSIFRLVSSCSPILRSSDFQSSFGTELHRTSATRESPACVVRLVKLCTFYTKF